MTVIFGDNFSLRIRCFVIRDWIENNTAPVSPNVTTCKKQSSLFPVESPSCEGSVGVGDERAMRKMAIKINRMPTD